MTSEVAILSPEKAIITFQIASFGSRISAHLIDLLVVGALIGLAVSVISGLTVLVSPLFGGAIAPSIILILFLYFILQEGLWNGQTLGKRAMGLRVRMADGTAITSQAAIGRNLLRTADFAPFLYFLGIATMFTNQKAQRLGDIAAGTMVLYERRGQPAFQVAPHLVGLHPLEQQVGELRGMTIEEYQALRRFCDRYPQLPFLIQERMLRELWTPIALRRGVPQIPNVHPLYLAEATVMKYGRSNGLL